MLRSALIIGKTGQLARALIATANDVDSLHALGRAELELSWPASKITAALKPYSDVDLIILAAAYTDVNKAEEEPNKALKINRDATRVVADFCAEKCIPLIYYSTDYVFNGESHRPYLPSDPTSPINSYGQSKLAGEEAIKTSQCMAIILRTSWVFDGQGKNFFSTMLSLADQNQILKIVSDQIGRPSYTGHIASASWVAAKAFCQDTSKAGTYNLTNSGDPVSWYNFAESIFHLAENYTNFDVTLEPISSSNYPAQAKRPAYSVLDLRAFEKTFDINLPDWNEGLRLAFAVWADG